MTATPGVGNGSAAAPRPSRPGVRVAFLSLLSLLALLWGIAEWTAHGDRAASLRNAGSGRGSDARTDANANADAIADVTVDLDVGAARDDVSRRLLALEQQCAGFAEDALQRTADISDPAALFTALEELHLPPSAGVQLEDRDRRVLAWAGTSVDQDALRLIPLLGDGAVIFDTPASRRLAVRRTRTVSQASVPARAVCHLPFEINYPVRNRFFASWSIAQDVRSRHRVGAVEILQPNDPRGEALPSAFGGEFARLLVTPLSARSWVEAADRDLATRRAWLVTVGALIAAGFIAWETRRFGFRRPAAAALGRAALVAGLRIAIAVVPMGSVLPASPATDPRRYAHGLPLAFAETPADLLLSCIAALCIAWCLRRAAQSARLRLVSLWPAVAGLFATAFGVRWALGEFIGDTVRNSRVAFFSDVSVLPQTASATLLAAVVAAGIAAVLLTGAAWTWLAPARSRGRAVLAVLTVSAAVVAAPSGPAGSANDVALLVTGAIGFAIALATLVFDPGTAARAGLIPLGVAVAVFAPLEQNLAASVRRAVEAQAEDRVKTTDATARLIVDRTLDELASSDALASAIREGRIRRDLQLRLWADSPLASRPGGSAIEIVPRDPALQRSRFSVNLPPLTWLPLPTALKLGDTADTPLAGRGAGRDGRWMIGSRRLISGGDHLANVWVTLEARPPSDPGLPELEILGPAGDEDSLRAPRLAFSRYGPAGELQETNDADRAAGAALAQDVRDDATGRAGPVWRRARVADRDLAVVVLPEAQGGTTAAFYAFSFDTGGTRRLALRGARAVLCGALLAAVAALLTVRRWTRGARMRLAYRIVLSYVVVSGLPLLLLGWANRELARQRADESALRELRQAVSLLDREVEKPGADLPLRLLEYGDADRDENLREMAYGVGHHANVFYGDDLLASSDQGLFDTDLLPRRLPGPVCREIRHLLRPFHAFPAHVGDETFDVGYSPIRAPGGQVVGAISVPLLNQRRLRDADVADGVTAILALYLASLVTAVGVGTWLAARLTRPLRDLTDATQRVAVGDLSQPVPEAGPGELGDVVLAFNRMMHDLAESRAQLVRAEKEAAWRDMARQVAHEVKNPLTPMRLAAEHLRRAWRDRVPNFDETLERGVDMIVRQTESLKRIATAFSDFARLPGRRRDPTDVADIVRRVADLYRSTPALAASADVEPGLPTVLADPDELHRVLVNLAKNAVEAMEGRPGTLALRLSRDGEWLVFDVADDGPGIPADVLPRLFEPYFSTKTSGTGLGLAICKRAIEDLGGTIAVRSESGKGTTVTVRIPVVTKPAA
ncbi:MAG: HAMP domain-containing histidine kinase [Planctomycetes bacterium]|nr:HAMP domain-containing histidine kinase [Planctomycetota bacterium]